METETVMVMAENHTFKEIIDQAVAELKKGCKELVLDFKYVTYMPSSTLGVIVALSKKFQDNGAILRLRDMSEEGLEQLKLFGLENLITGGSDAHS